MTSQNLQQLLDSECFLLDMDGTVYLGKSLLPGASALMVYLAEHKIPYYFLTNNSSRSKSDYVEKLTDFGLPVSQEQVFTSGQATAIYLNQKKPGADIYLVGTPALEKEFLQHGFNLVEKDPDFVVLGFDTTLTYDKIWKLCDFVREGYPYIATHPDINCPTEVGFMPDIGSMMAMVEASTGRKADVIVGKPHPPIISAIMDQTGYKPQEIVMVGDRLYTDIALGETGITTVLVLSGETKAQDLERASTKPNLVVDNLQELHHLFLEHIAE
ncbi:MAG: HAD-IIA family hydrolase [Anaerolineales bacterium]